MSTPTITVRREAKSPGEHAGGDARGPRARGPAATFATTEHFNLQTARAITVSEANGRASIYLAALSSNLIALAFIGQMSRLGVAFYAFALILLPVLSFVGVVTFLRLVQFSIEDLAYAHRIALAAQLLPAALAGARAVHRRRPRDTRRRRSAHAPGAWQLTLTTAGMVAVVNSVVTAACAGLVFEAAGRRSRSRSRSPSERSSALAPSRSTNATTAARSRPTAQRPSIGPRSSFSPSQPADAA